MKPADIKPVQQMKVSIFKSLDSYESKAVGLEEVMRLIRYDQSVEQKQALYHNLAYTVSKQKAKEQVKEHMMPAFSVGVLFKGYGRRVTDIALATGLAMCDLDHIERGKMDDVRCKIIADPHTLICYTTIGREGLRAIYRFVRQEGSQLLHINCEAYPAAWKKGNEYYRQLTGVDYDHACSDYGRLSGMAHDAEAYYNPDAEPFTVSDQEMLEASNEVAPAEPGKPRKAYEQGSQHAEAPAAWLAVQRILSLRGLSYTPNHRHDYMVQASYLFCRFGVDQAELKAWAEQEWSDMPGQERDGVISHCYRNGKKHFGTWRINRASKDRNVRRALMTTTEIRAWLEAHYRVYYNLVTDQNIFCKKSETVEYNDLDDREIETMRCDMEQDTGKRVLPRDLQSVLKSNFARLLHPVRSYIDTLPEWDGKDRVAELAALVTVEPTQANVSREQAQEQLLWALHKWLVGTVATWMSDRQRNEQVLVFIGAQGVYKTNFFRYLLPPPLRSYFWENNHNSFSQKDDKLALTEFCIADIEEIEAFGDRDTAELKSLISAYYIKERRPYAKFRTPKARLASFCATGNTQRFLTDLTGNRRWLCFMVSHIEKPWEWTLDYQQFYAQLRDEYLQGFQFWLDKPEEKRLERLNEPFRVVSKEEELINCRLTKPRGKQPFKRMNATMIAIYLTGYLNAQLSVRKISEVMRMKKFHSTTSRGVEYFHVVEVQLMEVQNHIQLTEDTLTPEDEDVQPSEPEQLPLIF